MPAHRAVILLGLSLGWGATASLAQPLPLPTPAVRVDSYALGAGDRLRIDVLGEEQLSGEQEIPLDGILNFPLVGSIAVDGLTAQELKAELETRLLQFLRRPDVTVRLLSRRPFNIAVVGEVRRPGPYRVGVETVTGLAGAQTGTGNVQAAIPRLTTLIQVAGGVTQNADIRNVQVRRPQRGGLGDRTFSVDLWELLQRGDPAMDLVLLDGDSVLVPRATSVNLSEAPQLGAANFAPTEIVVNVAGEVARPGQVRLPPNASLNEAILAAGGFNVRADAGTVQLLRLNSNGTVDTRDIAVNFKLGLNEQINPPLQNSDIVLIRPTGLAQTSDTLRLVLDPFVSINTFVNLVNLLFSRR